MTLSYKSPEAVSVEISGRLGVVTVSTVEDLMSASAIAMIYQYAQFCMGVDVGRLSFPQLLLQTFVSLTNRRDTTP